MTTIAHTENELVAPDAIKHDIEWRNQMATIARTESELVAGLYGLLSDAITHDIERRSKLRDPFIAPVVIYPNGDEGCCLTALTRDISTNGIGLVHAFPLECTDVVIKVFGADGKPTHLYARIEWCNSLGEGWHVSGGRFIYRLNGMENEPEMVPENVEVPFQVPTAAARPNTVE